MENKRRERWGLWIHVNIASWNVHNQNRCFKNALIDTKEKKNVPVCQTLPEKLPGELSVTHRPESYTAVHRLPRLVAQGYNSWHDNKVTDKHRERSCAQKKSNSPVSAHTWWIYLELVETFINAKLWRLYVSYTSYYTETLLLLGVFV